jgi:hypothetical protein
MPLAIALTSDVFFSVDADERPRQRLADARANAGVDLVPEIPCA